MINFTSSLNESEVKFINSDGTSKKTLVTATNDTRLYSIMGTCSDVTARPIVLYLSDGVKDYLAYTVNIPANAGFITNVNPVDIMYAANGVSLMFHSYDSNYGLYFTIPAGWSLKANLTSTISSPYNVIISVSYQSH
jgi:hypothetical protein